MQAIGRFLVGVDDSITQLFKLFVNLFPVVSKLLEDSSKRLSKGGLKIGVIVEIHIQVMANRMFDRSGLCLRARMVADILFKVLIKYRYRWNFDIDPSGLQIGISDCSQLRRNPLHAEALVAEV